MGQKPRWATPRWATPIFSSNFDKSMPLLCYAFYLYAKSIKASNHYAFQVKALFCLCLYSNSPDSKVYFTVEPIFHHQFILLLFCSLQLHDLVYCSIQYVGLSSKSADTMATTTRLSNVRGAGPAVECGLKNCKPCQIKMFEIGR